MHMFYICLMFIFKRKPAYRICVLQEFRRVLFRSIVPDRIEPTVTGAPAAHALERRYGGLDPVGHDAEVAGLGAQIGRASGRGTDLVTAVASVYDHMT